MQVYFKPSFIKDFKQLPFETQREVRYICEEVFPKAGTIRDISGSYRILVDVRPSENVIARRSQPTKQSQKSDKH